MENILFPITNTIAEWGEEEVGGLYFREHNLQFLTVRGDLKPLQKIVTDYKDQFDDLGIELRFAYSPGETQDNYWDPIHSALHTQGKVGADGLDGEHCHIQFGKLRKSEKDAFVPLDGNDEEEKETIRAAINRLKGLIIG